jgi:VanZ family protein
LSLRRALLLWGPVAAFAAFLFFLSGQRQIPAADLVWDKLLHAIGYGAFALLAIRAFHGGFGPMTAGATTLAFLFTVGYGITDEIHQSFVPGRNPSALDVVADAVGFALAAGVLFLRYHAFRGPDVDPAS